MSIKRITVLLLCVNSIFCQVVFAAPDSTSVSEAKSHNPLRLEASEIERNQKRVFDYLLGKTGKLATTPTYPTNELLNWTRENYQGAGRNSQKMYVAIAQHLRAAQPLLSDENQQQNLRGLRVAYDASIKTAVQLKDKTLCALVFDGFIVPYLGSARSGESDLLSKQRLLQNAANAYRLTEESSKQIVVLNELVGVADAAGNVGLADWARVKLAEVLETQERYSEAINNLQAVQSPNLQGSKKWIPALQKKLQQQKQQSPK